MPVKHCRLGQAGDEVRPRPGLRNMSHPWHGGVGGGGADETRGSLFGQVDLEERIPSRRPLRNSILAFNRAARSKNGGARTDRNEAVSTA